MYAKYKTKLGKGGERNNQGNELGAVVRSRSSLDIDLPVYSPQTKPPVYTQEIQQPLPPKYRLSMILPIANKYKFNDGSFKYERPYRHTIALPLPVAHVQ
ncbi:hypothetical protein GGF37_001768, partial [Kickxella alabastrina]